MVSLIISILHASPIGPLPGLLPLPHTLLGSALGLLLVFRTNAAYDRFWEARKQWGIVTAECRSVAGLACTFMTPRQALPMLTLVAAFPVVMKSYLRGQRDTRRLKALLNAQECAGLDSVVNQPQYVLMRLRLLTQQARVTGVSEKERETLFKSIGALGEAVSVCERIYNTPIPLAYSRHTSRFLVLYMSTLPLALVGALRWATILVSLVVTWALFGILEIGNLIEEPFTAVTDVDNRQLLPLTEVCRTIRRDVRAIALYAQLAKECGAPTMKPNPSDSDMDLPEGFTALRSVLTVPKKDGAASDSASNATSTTTSSGVTSSAEGIDHAASNGVAHDVVPVVSETKRV